MQVTCSSMPWPAAQLSELVLSDKADLSPAIEGEGSVLKQSSQFSSLECDTDLQAGCCSSSLLPLLGKGPFRCAGQTSRSR